MSVKIGFIGSGNMAFALISGFIKSNLIPPENITVTGKTGRSFPKYKNLNNAINTSLDNYKLFKTCNIIFYAAKPYQYDEILKDLKQKSGEEKIDAKFDDVKKQSILCTTFVSVAAGIKISKFDNFLEEIFGVFKSFHIIRCMPNTPCLIGQGCIAYAYNEDASLSETEKSQTNTVIELLKTCAPNAVEKVKESQISSICGLAGSGPAFIYTLIEAMSDAGVKNGLPRDVATKFAAQTFSGAAGMVLETGKHTGELKDQVTSSGGTTIEGIFALEKAGGRNAIMEAVEAATRRANELGKE